MFGLSLKGITRSFFLFAAVVGLFGVVQQTAQAGVAIRARPRVQVDCYGVDGFLGSFEQNSYSLNFVSKKGRILPASGGLNVRGEGYGTFTGTGSNFQLYYSYAGLTLSISFPEGYSKTAQCYLR